MRRSLWHKTLWAAAGLALQLGATQAFAQSAPATTPSTPPVTTPPPPAANPPTGGPNSMPPGEPANAINSTGTPGADGLAKGANSFTEAQARDRLRTHGYAEVSALTKGQDGIWRGSATRNGHQVHVGLDYKGNITSN